MLVWPADGDPTKNEGSGAVSALYPVSFGMVGTSDGIQLPDFAFCDSHAREYCFDGNRDQESR